MFIFSVFNSYNDLGTNLFQSSQVEKYLRAKGIPFKALEGMYKGDMERSFALPDTALDVVTMLCDLYRQECYLHVNPATRKAVFINADNTQSKPLSWTQVYNTKDIDGYTRDLETGMTFTLVPV